MRKTPILTLAFLLLCAPVLASDAPWFDLENCGMCKHMMKAEGMLMQLGWEHHKTASGFMTVTTVPDQWKDAYAEAMTAMHATGENLMAGEQMPLCGMCVSYSGFMMEGKATMEHFHTIGGEVTLLTTNDPATLAKMHAHVDRTVAELAKFTEAGE